MPFTNYSRLLNISLMQAMLNFFAILYCRWESAIRHSSETVPGEL